MCRLKHQLITVLHECTHFTIYMNGGNEGTQKSSVICIIGKDAQSSPFYSFVLFGCMQGMQE